MNSGTHIKADSLRGSIHKVQDAIATMNKNPNVGVEILLGIGPQMQIENSNDAKAVLKAVKKILQTREEELNKLYDET